MTRYQIWQEIENIETQINELKAKQNTLYAELKKLPSGVELKVLEVKSVKRGICRREDVHSTDEEYEMIERMLGDHPTWGWEKIADQIIRGDGADAQG